MLPGLGGHDERPGSSACLPEDPVTVTSPLAPRLMPIVLPQQKTHDTSTQGGTQLRWSPSLPLANVG